VVVVFASRRWRMAEVGSGADFCKLTTFDPGGVAGGVNGSAAPIVGDGGFVVEVLLAALRKRFPIVLKKVFELMIQILLNTVR